MSSVFSCHQPGHKRNSCPQLASTKPKHSSEIRPTHRTIATMLQCHVMMRHQPCDAIREADFVSIVASQVTFRLNVAQPRKGGKYQRNNTQRGKPQADAKNNLQQTEKVESTDDAELATQRCRRILCCECTYRRCSSLLCRCARHGSIEPTPFKLLSGGGRGHSPKAASKQGMAALSAFLVNFTIISNRLIRVDVVISDVYVGALVDTGASCSFMDQPLVE